MPDYHRWELVEFRVSLPADWHDVSAVLDELREELGDRAVFRDAVKVIVEDDELVFRYRKALDRG